MPKINKAFHLEITVEQFLDACSYLELQELSLQLDSHLRRAEHDQRRKAYREGKDPEEISQKDTIGEGTFLFMKIPKL